MKTIELQSSEVHLRKDGIMHIHIHPGVDMQLDDAVQVVEAMRKLGKGKKFPVLIDAGEFSTIDKEVRIFSAGEESNIYTVADALAYSSFAQKLMADFYVKHNKPVVPTRVFPDKASAIKWLKTFIKPGKLPGTWIL